MRRKYDLRRPLNLEDKKELVRLLNLYQAEILKEDTENRSKGAWQTGIKAQYNHARIISSKLSQEISKAVYSGQL